MERKCLDKGQESPCHKKKKPGKVRARAYVTKLPSRWEALRFIDLAKSHFDCLLSLSLSLCSTYQLLFYSFLLPTLACFASSFVLIACFGFVPSYYRKRGNASYIVREVRTVREREREIQRERERETDGSDVTLVALKLAKSFAIFLAKTLHLSFSPLKWR